MIAVDIALAGGFLILFTQRLRSVQIFLVLAFLLTFGSKVMVGSMDFYPLRIIVFFGLVRVFTRREYHNVSFNRIDKSLIFWAIIMTSIYTLKRGDFSAFINRLGSTLNLIGPYFFFRYSIKSMDEVRELVKVLTAIIIVVAILMFHEFSTGKNVFALLGGVHEHAVVRGGEIRAQGPFRHPILAGTFAATSLPLLLILWNERSTNRALVATGMAGILIIILSTSSGGPIISVVVGIAIFMLWLFKAHLRAFQWAGVTTIFGISLVMTAPIWYIFAKLSRIVGGTGWHRSFLIDQAIKHLDEWWLLGTQHTANWMPYTLANNPDMADITNHFLVQGVNGGLLTMGAFIFVLLSSFKPVGVILRSETSEPNKYAIWGFGVSLFVHFITFFSVSYFDQIIVHFAFVLSTISLTSNPASFERFMEGTDSG